MYGRIYSLKIENKLEKRMIDAERKKKQYSGFPFSGYRVLRLPSLRTNDFNNIIAFTIPSQSI